MSFLLDALRKSEIERRVGEIPGLTPHAPLPSARQKRHPTIFLGFVLVLINVATLLTITLLDRVEPSDAKENPPRSEVSRSIPDAVEKEDPEAAGLSAKVEIPKVPGPDANPSKKTQSPAQQAERSSAWPNPIDLQPPGLAPDPNPPADHRLIETNQPKVSALKPIPPKQNRTSARQQPPVETITRSHASEPAPASTTVKPSLNPDRPEPASYHNPALEKPVAVAKIAPTPPPAKPATDTIPLLSEMPRDFQREAPSLNINVFVYSDLPEERFVVINMSKYRTGQKIDSGPEIIEIGPNSLVLEYLGRKFRVERP